MAQTFLEPDSADNELDPMAPIAPTFKTSLQLTPEQLDNLVQRALDRINDLRTEMGLIARDDGGLVEGWMWQRMKNQLQYDNDWSWRKAIKGIFKFSNFSLNLSKRYTRLMAAKVTDDLVGTDPFFQVMPTEHGEPELAKQGEFFVQEGIAASNVKRNVRGGQKTALIRNECTVKLGWVNNDTHFRGPGVVAVGPFRYEGPKGDILTAPGDPIMTPKGQFIYRNDNVFEDPNTAGLFRLEKEPGVAFKYQLRYAFFDDLDQTLRGENGLTLRECDYRDFLCPLNASSVHEADINVHLFDEQWELLKARYKGFDISQAFIDNAYTSGEKQPRIEKAEEPSVSKTLKIVHCADVFIRCNPFADGPNDLGVESEIWLVLDLNAQKAIWYDYLGNHMKKRPFEVIPGVEKVQNRWYGVGVFEMLQHKQDYVDTQFNRVNWASMKASSLRFRIKNAVTQWKAGQKMVFGDDTVWDIEDPRFDARNPPFFEVPPREINAEAMKLIELMIQAGSTEVGIVGPDDAAIAGLDSGQLATGIKSLERTGNLLMKFTEQDHADSIIAILDQCVDIMLEHMDEDELLFKKDTGELLKLNRDEIRKLKKSCTLLLTRSRSTETIEMARMAVQLVREYYEVLTPYEQYKVRPLYLSRLKALEVPDGTQLLDEVSKVDAEKWKAQQAAKPPPLPPKTSIATKYDTLERTEQEQVLNREGIVPASRGEVAASEQHDQQMEIAKTAAEAKATEAAKPKETKPAAKK